MGIRVKFDLEKTLEALLYITQQVQNTYNALKVLYFADKDHLAKYGRLICGDSYVAMKQGPVPSGAYDVVKVARGDGGYWPSVDIKGLLKVEGQYDIIPLRPPDLDMLSETDIECLDAAIEEYGNMSFGRLQEISHDAAYKSANQDDIIPLESIIKSLPNGDMLLDYFSE